MLACVCEDSGNECSQQAVTAPLSHSGNRGADGDHLIRKPKSRSSFETLAVLASEDAPVGCAAHKNGTRAGLRSPDVVDSVVTSCTFVASLQAFIARVGSGRQADPAGHVSALEGIADRAKYAHTCVPILLLWPSLPFLKIDC